MAFIDFSLLARATDDVRTFEPGATIFAAGDVGDVFYIIKSGTVAIKVDGHTVDTLGAADVFGEMALIDQEPRSAAAVAETACELAVVSEKQFLFMTSEAPYFALSLMRVLVARLRAANAAGAVH